MNLEWKQYEEKFNKEVEVSFNWLQSEFNKVRSGRANPALIEGVKVEAYGSYSSLNELANVQVPEPRSLVVKPFDPGTVHEIAKAIIKYNDTLNPIIDNKIIRINIPAPTEESRKKSVKVIKDFLEKTKIAIRNSRKNIQAAIKAAKYQEGLEKMLLESLEKLVKQANDQADSLFKAKEKDLLTI